MSNPFSARFKNFLALQTFQKRPKTSQFYAVLTVIAVNNSIIHTRYLISPRQLAHLEFRVEGSLPDKITVIFGSDKSLKGFDPI